MLRQRLSSRSHFEMQRVAVMEGERFWMDVQRFAIGWWIWAWSDCQRNKPRAKRNTKLVLKPHHLPTTKAKTTYTNTQHILSFERRNRNETVSHDERRKDEERRQEWKNKSNDDKKVVLINIPFLFVGVFSSSRVSRCWSWCHYNYDVGIVIGDDKNINETC